MTWIIEFVLRISMGVIGGALFCVIGSLLGRFFLGELLPNHNSLVDLNKGLNIIAQEFSVNSDHNLLKFLIIISIINAIFGMFGSKSKDEDIDLRKENEDWWFDTQELEIYGHKI